MVVDVAYGLLVCTDSVSTCRRAAYSDSAVICSIYLCKSSAFHVLIYFP